MSLRSPSCRHHWFDPFPCYLGVWDTVSLSCPFRVVPCHILSFHFFFCGISCYVMSFLVKSFFLLWWFFFF